MYPSRTAPSPRGTHRQRREHRIDQRLGRRASEPYSAAKAGLQNLTLNLAARYGADGVRFNLIAPATIRTRVWDDQAEELERLRPMYPLGRVGTPDDIAAAVAFLASDDAAWITGITLPIDGGLLAAGPLRL